jgi:predicted metal-dependent phosphoesterase TrpH
MATVASINLFPNYVRTASEAYSSSITYHNREQLSYDKWDQMCTILRNPKAFKPIDKESKNLKHRAQFDFELINNKLYRQSNARYANSRYVVPTSKGV